MFVNYVSDFVIKRVISANRLLNSPVGVNVHRKNREFWAVALKTKGKTIYTVDNQNYISDSLHPIILPKGSSYSWQCTEPGECIIIEFDAEKKDTKLSSFEISDNSRVVNAFSKIEKVLNTKKQCYCLESLYYLYEILIFLLKSHKTENQHPKKISALKPAINYITQNYYDPTITNETLSSLCGISTVYFRKSFESVYKLSPIKYLNNLRIDKAKALLLSDYETIEQVATSVGYNSIYHFSKMFKKHTGVSPSEYAKAPR